MNRRTFLASIGAGVLASTPLLRAMASDNLPEFLRFSSAERDNTAHFLNRVAFGARPGDAEKVRQMGFEAYIEQQMNPDAIWNMDCLRRLGNYFTLDMTGRELFDRNGQAEEVAQQLKGATLLRAVYSEAQLWEVMTSFWLDHFNVYHAKDHCQLLVTLYDRDTIRAHAFGRFRDLLGATARSGAMLLYLDNSKSLKWYPNENYAREIMELHTVGVGHYTEDDVKAVARCLTGWTYVLQPTSRNWGNFAFHHNGHDTDEKVVLGTVIPAGGGVEDGERVLDILAAHPNTARRISEKLCRRFIGDVPPTSIIDAAARTFIDTDGDIRAVLRTILFSDEFWQAPPKFKRPFEYTVSLLRQIGADMTSPVRDPLFGYLQRMGHLPFNWVFPDGYPDVESRWMGSLLDRWSLAIEAVQGTLPGVRVDLLGTAAQQGISGDPQEVIAFFAALMLGRSLTQNESDALTRFVQRTASDGSAQSIVTDAVSLIAASPAYQYR
jgi:hypothetical protein